MQKKQKIKNIKIYQKMYKCIKKLKKKEKFVIIDKEIKKAK